MPPPDAPHGLPSTAYELRPGETYVPHTQGQELGEFTVKAAASGALLGLLFGAANTYLGLLAGLTISTSIPVAVLTVVVFRALAAAGVRHSILESNLSQTVGSASSSVASGLLFTIPALFMWGMTPEWAQITLLAMAGGLIGVLFMIPLRRYLIQQEHGRLPFPEGMACAEVLVAAEGDGQGARGVFRGIGAGVAFQLIVQGARLVPGALELALPWKAGLAARVSAPLLGVGYILGIRGAAVMATGGLLSSMVLIPLIGAWGGGLAEATSPQSGALLRDLSAGQIWDRYIRFIGAGAVAAAGLMTLIRGIPTMVESLRLGLPRMRGDGRPAQASPERTDVDLSWRAATLILVAIVLGLAFTPRLLGHLESTPARAVAALCIAAFAFLFVTVSARIVGLVGVTSNPTSGMTIATLLGTATVFYLMGWTDGVGKATVLMVGTVVCVAASIAGDTSQDLKTGYVLGATPRLQQLGEMLGVVTSAGVVALVILVLDRSTPGGLGGAELPAPQATLMSLVVEGVLEQSLPWSLVLIGAGIAGAAFLLGVPALPFAVGVYLPLSTMGAVFLGGLLRWSVTRGQSPEVAQRRRQNGILFASGLVGGGGLTGVILAVWVVAGRGGQAVPGWPPAVSGPAEAGLAAAALAAVLGAMALAATKGSRR